MYTNNKRIARLLGISIAMNFLLFSASYFLNLPLWLDTTGTMYAATILGAPAGSLVAIVNNLTESIFFYGDQSLFFYFVSLFTAYATAYIFKKYNNKKIVKWVILTIALVFIEGFFSVLITFLVNSGIPSNFWSMKLYYIFLKNGKTSFFSTIYSVLIIKIPDILISVFVTSIAVKITPRKLKTTDMIIIDF